MSVALMSMEAAYGLRLGVGGHHHHHHHLHHRHRRACSPTSPNDHVNHENDDDRPQDPSESSLGFSVANILRPDFGKKAILSTRVSPKLVKPTALSSPIISPLPIHSPIPLPRDLSLSSSRLSPQSLTTSGFAVQKDRESFSSHCGLTSPVQRHSGLSRSGSLESLASSRSSIAGSSVNGAPSLCSASSTTGGESVSGESSSGSKSPGAATLSQNGNWPAWVYCTRYSDRPSSGPRTRRVKRQASEMDKNNNPDEKRPRTAFSAEQLARLKREFDENRYLTEKRRQQLSKDLGLNEAQIKIWFQNKRAKLKKSTGQKNPLALQLMAQGLYNHSTVPVDEDGDELDINANKCSEIRPLLEVALAKLR